MLTTNYVHKMDYHLSDRDLKWEKENGYCEGRNWRSPNDWAIMQLYWSAHYGPRGSINCSSWPGHDKN